MPLRLCGKHTPPVKKPVLISTAFVKRWHKRSIQDKNEKATLKKA